MVYIENGTYTAVRRRAPHHCTRFPPEAMHLPNWGVLSAASCKNTCSYAAVASGSSRGLLSWTFCYLWLIDWLIDRQKDRPTDWSTDRATDSLTDRLTSWKADCPIDKHSLVTIILKDIHSQSIIVKFEVQRAMKFEAFWNAKACRPVNIYLHFEAGTSEKRQQFTSHYSLTFQKHESSTIT